MTGLEALGGVMLLVMLVRDLHRHPDFAHAPLPRADLRFHGHGRRVFDLAYLQTIGMMKQDEFVAVPMFILMGYICDQAGLLERLFIAFRDLFAPVRGSLYLVVLLTATLFGIAAGTVGATVVLLGIMAGPMMIKSGYDIRMSAGAIAAGGTLGILIPPSVMLVVMGPVLGVSVAKLYEAACGPGFMLAGMYILYTMGRSFINPKLGPACARRRPSQADDAGALGMRGWHGADHGADDRDARRDHRRADDFDRSGGHGCVRRDHHGDLLRALHVEGPDVGLPEHAHEHQHGALSSQ
jgi:TRAP-type mannitol/chloroaromatic compound transport system permease large subunit